MLGVLRDHGNDLPVRMDAAKAAAPYMHARLESIKHSGDEESPVHVKHQSDAAFKTLVATLDKLHRDPAGGDKPEGGVARDGET